MSYRTQQHHSPYAPPPPPVNGVGAYGEPINTPYGGGGSYLERSSTSSSSAGRYSPQSSEHRTSQRSIYAPPVAAPYMPTPAQYSPPYQQQHSPPYPRQNSPRNQYYNQPIPSAYSHAAPSPPPASESNGWGSPNPTPGDVAAAVKSLLLATKELQDALRKWSVEQVDESAVSDVYVRIGTEFNQTVTAFAYHGIDLSDIHDVPGNLRLVLEQCLGEDPSPQALETYLPDVRRVLWELLSGLKHRQAEWQALSVQGRGRG